MAASASERTQTQPHRFLKPGQRHCLDCRKDLNGRGVQAQRCIPCAKVETIRKLSKTRNGNKDQARQELYKARRRGLIVRPDACEMCGTACTPHGHHHRGYFGAAVLDVQWLCVNCHGKAHVEMNERRRYLHSHRASTRANWSEYGPDKSGLYFGWAHRPCPACGFYAEHHPTCQIASTHAARLAHVRETQAACF